MMDLNIEEILNGYNGKTIDICWTGGVDSTLLLVLLLDRVNSLRAISLDVRGFGRPTQRDAEAAARKRIKKLLDLKPSNGFKHVVVDGGVQYRQAPFVYIQQPYIASVLPYTVSAHADEVLLSYVLDDKVGYWDKLVGIYQSTSAFLPKGESLPKLTAPLLEVTYLSLFQYAYKKLPVVFPELLALTISCEDPGYNEELDIGTSCGVCAKCKNRIVENKRSGSLIWDDYESPVELLKLIEPEASFVSMKSSAITIDYLALRKYRLTYRLTVNGKETEAELHWRGVDKYSEYPEQTYEGDSFIPVEYKNANSVSA